MDWGCFGYTAVDDGKGRLWAFVMVLSRSRWMYLEFVSRMDDCGLTPGGGHWV